VAVNPGEDVLPPFAKKYKVELLAERSDGNVLVSAKSDPMEVEKDEKLSELADIVAKQRGWRFDLTLLKPPAPPDPPKPQQIGDLTEQQIKERFQTAERLYDAGFEPQAALTAWAAFESAMRHRLRSLGEKTGYGASLRSMLNELITSGEIDQSQFRDLEGLMDLRNVLVHGFALPPIGRGAIVFLADLGLKLIEPLEVEVEDDDA
jgi:hypothetical protein